MTASAGSLLSPDAVTHYLTVSLPLDVLYPATAGLFFATLLVLLTRRGLGATGPMRHLPWMGVAMTLADWCENALVFGLLTLPDAPAALDLGARLAIAAKFTIGIATVIATLALGVYVVGDRMLRGRWPRDR